MRALLPLAAVLVLTGCSGIRVQTDYDTHAGLERMKTYDWLSSQRMKQGREGVDAIAARRVIHHVDAALAAKGLKLEKQGEPDLLVAFEAVYRNRAVRTTTHLGTGWGGGPFRFRTGTSFSEVRRVREGSIVLRLLDGKTQEVVWQSMAEGALDRAGSPEEAEAMVADAVGRMLADFPRRR